MYIAVPPSLTNLSGQLAEFRDCHSRPPIGPRLPGCGKFQFPGKSALLAWHSLPSWNLFKKCHPNSLIIWISKMGGQRWKWHSQHGDCDRSPGGVTWMFHYPAWAIRSYSNYLPAGQIQVFTTQVHNRNRHPIRYWFLPAAEPRRLMDHNCSP